MRAGRAVVGLALAALVAGLLPAFRLAAADSFRVASADSAAPVRIFGSDAVATAIAISQAEFPNSGSANAVVLARSDFFSDALAGGPLAASKGGPLLITPGAAVSSTLDPRVKAEIERVLPSGGTVYVLGGDLALSANIDTTLKNLGYTVVREAGADEYATAVDIAEAMGSPSTVFEATGLTFFDALSAVPAAIKEHAAILLTDGATQAPETAGYLAQNPNDTRYAIGGSLAAAGADPQATPVFGEDLFNTSAAVASRFFPGATVVGAATAASFPDALGGGVFMATGGRLGPLLLVDPSTPLPAEIVPYLETVPSGSPSYVFGGSLALEDTVVSALQSTLGASSAGCVQVTAWSADQLVEQLLMVSGQFSDLSASSGLASAGVGGFVLFGQPPSGSGPSITSGIDALLGDASQAGQVMPWMSTDEEGGEVQRLANVLGALPTARQMAAQWTPAQVQSNLAAHATAMRSLGITMDLAPVIDTAPPTDPYSDESDRSFSEDGPTAAAYGVAFAAGLESGGVVPVAKHFPGIGHANGGTDEGPATDPPLSSLETDDLIPFEAEIEGGIPAIMVGHPIVPGLTNGLPASLSSATYGFLRGNLNFSGVAITDSLGAGAVSAAGFSEPAAAVTAIEAGADMVLIDASSWSASVSALEQALGGPLAVAAVEDSVSRILQAKGIPLCAS